VLCQQPLQPSGAARMQRFQAYMYDTLDKAATKAEQAVIDTTVALPVESFGRAFRRPQVCLGTASSSRS
jgi:hypothetical protein